MDLPLRALRLVFLGRIQEMITEHDILDEEEKYFRRIEHSPQQKRIGISKDCHQGKHRACYVTCKCKCHKPKHVPIIAQVARNWKPEKPKEEWKPIEYLHPRKEVPVFFEYKKCVCLGCDKIFSCNITPKFCPWCGAAKVVF